MRALESAWDEETGRVEAMEGATDLFILPGHPFHAVDALVTNFHLPRSTLLMMLAAFAGRDRVNELDILHAAELALPHRLKKQPLEDPDAYVQDLQARIDEVRNRVREQESESTSRGEPAERWPRYRN